LRNEESVGVGLLIWREIFLRELDGESNREPKMLKMERNLLRELDGDSNRESKLATLLEMLLSFKCVENVNTRNRLISCLSIPLDFTRQ